jgi:hypothetical protein
MKRRRARASGANPPPATNTEASRAPSPPGDDAALAALLASALEAQARRREDDLPAELAATDLLRTCLSAALLAEGATREALVQTARREFDRAVAPRAAPRARSRAA